MAKSKSAARPLLLVTLLVASAGAGWLAVNAALPGRPGLSTLASEAATSPWIGRAEALAVEIGRVAARAGEAAREAAASLAGEASALAEAASPVIAQAAAEAREAMRDPGTGPAIAGGLGLLAGLALGFPLGRRRPGRLAAPADAAATATAPPTIAEAPQAAKPAERPFLPAAPLLAGTVPHRPALPDLTPPAPAPARPTVAEADPRAALIEGVLRILAEETSTTPGPEAEPRRVA